MDLTQRTETFAVDDQSWLGSRHGVGNAQSVTLDTSAFTPSIHYPDGFFKSGLALGKITATGLYGPYAGTTDEVQTVTVTGSPTGGTFTLTFGGQTTSALAYNAAASAVQTALAALSTIGAGNVVVTGSAGGPYTVAFLGTLADTNVNALTATPSLTGGSSPGVTIATPTQGGSPAAADGTEKFVGLLLYPVKAPELTTTDVAGAMLEHGKVVNSRLPVPVDSAGRANAPLIIFA